VSHISGRELVPWKRLSREITFSTTWPKNSKGISPQFDFPFSRFASKFRPVHPDAFTIGSFTVRWYGVMVALAFLAGLWTASRRSPREGIPGEKIVDLGPWLILGAIVGSRALYVMVYWREFAGKPFWEIFMVHRGGLVFYGGLIGASLAAIVYIRIRKLPLWKTADVLAPSVALGYVFGRIGCLLNGCCYGRTCDVPWAITFPPSPDLPGRPIDPLHPTQVYDSVLNFGFYLGLAWLFRHKKFDGQVFAVYLVGYALLRSFVELFRGDYPHYLAAGWITPAHLVSVGILIVGVALLWFLPRGGVKMAQKQ
jgi:phosphatidylglycerol---prolipoprotein diacylglyceryl transferase